MVFIFSISSCFAPVIDKVNDFSRAVRRCLDHFTPLVIHRCERDEACAGPSGNLAGLTSVQSSSIPMTSLIRLWPLPQVPLALVHGSATGPSGALTLLMALSSASSPSLRSRIMPLDTMAKPLRVPTPSGVETTSTPRSWSRLESNTVTAGNKKKQIVHRCNNGHLNDNKHA